MTGKTAGTLLLFAALAVSAASCNSARISGHVSGLGKGEKICIQELDGKVRRVADSVSTGEGGRFDVRLKMKKGDRKFFFLYRGSQKLSSLILSPGESVEVECDTVGNWTVDGSGECENLRRNELALASVSRIDPLTMKDYILHYRSMLSYVMSNTHSLTSVPVLFQKIGDVPVFAQPSDGVIFQTVADSLQAEYPSSPYVAMLREEARGRINLLNIAGVLNGSDPVDYPEIRLPDLDAQTRTLTECTAARTLLVFWDASDVNGRLFNLDVLSPLWEKYAGRGFEIYQVGLLSDKATWALTVRQQALPWTNVYDESGVTIQTYRISRVPSVFLIEDGALRKIADPDLKSLSKALQ